MKSRILAILVMSLILGEIQAQSKEEKKQKKEIKAQMKAMDPFEFKKMQEENASMKTEVAGLNDQVFNLQQQLNTKDAEILNAKNELEEVKRTAEAAATTAPVNAPTEANEIVATKGSIKGVVYKVQIGSFRNRNLSKYIDNNPNFSGETDPDGAKKYTLGYFKDYWEADNFKKYLREMGVKDAWIVAYKDGKRVQIKEAREGETIKAPKS